MQNNQTALHIKQLEREREEILEEIAELRQAFKSRVDADIGEGDPGGAERGKVMSLIHFKERKLHAIDQALEEMRQGHYGICERCGNPIDPDRLAVVPETTFCIDCQRIEEQHGQLAFA